MHPEEQVSSFNPDPDLIATMGLNWKSVEAAHVTVAYRLGQQHAC
jgi:hypothetical protein